MHIFQHPIALFDLLTFLDLKFTVNIPFLIRPMNACVSERLDGLISCLFSGQLKGKWCCDALPSVWSSSPTAFTTAWCAGTADRQSDERSLRPSFHLPAHSSSSWMIIVSSCLSQTHLLIVLAGYRGSLSPAVCRGLCVLAVELADGRRIPNQPRLPHRSANEPKQLIGHSAGVPPTRIITFLSRSGLV